MDEDLSSIDRSRTPWVIFIGWVVKFSSGNSLAKDWSGRETRLQHHIGLFFLIYFVFWNLESVLCLWDTINNIWHFTGHCRHRPMYSSHGGILPNVDSNFVASVEPLLLNYQVKNHEVQNTLHHIIPEIIVVWSQCAIYGDMFWLCGE